MPFITMHRLIEFGTRLLAKKGVRKANARYIAETAVLTEAFGITTHGLALFGYFDAQIPSALDPKAEPKVVKERGASATIDANNGFGQLSLKLARELGAKKAREHGVAMIGIRNGFWLGALGVHLIPLVREGLLAQLWAQTSTCKDCAPFGGIDARFSTNPLALAFPTGGDPMIADFSTASYSLGRVKRLAQRGEKAPEPLFLDKDGNSSTDPKAMLDGGSIHFVGGATQGYKGYALSLWCEALTALGGGDCNNPAVPTRQSINLTVIDPEAFAGREAYLKQMKSFVVHVKSSRRLRGVDAIRLPGEGGFQKLREAESKGVPLDDAAAAKLNELAAKNGIVKV